MLTPEAVAELNDIRGIRGIPPGTTICPAPSINLHFSQLGVVTACCFNRNHVLGVYPQNSVRDIWHGEPIRELRAALAGYDLTKGCEQCLQQIEGRDFGGSHALFYTHYAQIATARREEWGMHPDGDPKQAPLPVRLEFNIHNACNLECVMCHGLASSKIRAHREGLPPLANPYDEAFADQLEPFLPYVVEADFMGGEPFLIPTYTMLWERVAVKNPRMRVCILTNGTILNDRIKRLLEGFNCWIHVSIDSIKKDTYESIRKGASFEQVMENCEYFLELMNARELPFMWRFCPLRQNWTEIPEAVDLCNRKGIVLTYNQVDSPLNFSLHTLPPAELQAVVAYLQRNIPPAEGTKTALENRQLYLEFVQRLEGFLDPRNRLNGLRARLDTSAAVVAQYYNGRKSALATKRASAPTSEELTDALTQASKRYVTTRLNVEQARQSGLELPGGVSGAINERLKEMSGLLPEIGAEKFVEVFLNELVRTYSGVWGVHQAHDGDLFSRVERLSAALAAHPDSQRIVTALLHTSPGKVYEVLTSSRSWEELTEQVTSRYGLPVNAVAQR